MEWEYKTISAPSTGILKEKGSKFEAYTFPCSDEDTAKAHIARLRKENPGANHVCFAWRFGTDKHHDRYSDDGEPNNSAGKPIFGQIESHGLTNILVAVVRYFGGTKLGVGGLVRAYKESASVALQNADIVTKYVCNYYELIFSAEDTGLAMKTLSSMSAEILEHGFAGNSPMIRFKIPLNKTNEALDKLESQPAFELIFIRTA